MAAEGNCGACGEPVLWARLDGVLVAFERMPRRGGGYTLRVPEELAGGTRDASGAFGVRQLSTAAELDAKTDARGHYRRHECPAERLFR